MIRCSRSLSYLILLLCGSALMLGPAGCASTKAREKWWQFWRPKKVASAGAEGFDSAVPPPPEIAGSVPPPGGWPIGSDGNAFPVPGVPPGALPALEPIRQAPAGAASELSMVYFAFDSYDLDSIAQETLEQNLAWMNAHAGVQILIEGHCDERGTTEYNYGLGERRANAVKAYLVQRGVAAESLHTISYGEERPLDPSPNEAAYAQNRRAQFLLY